MRPSLACLLVIAISQATLGAGRVSTTAPDQQPRRVDAGEAPTGRDSTPSVRQPVPEASRTAVAEGNQARGGPEISCPTTTPCVLHSNKHVRTHQRTALDAPLTVAMGGLQDWAAISGHDPNALRLWLAGRMLPALKPTLANVQQEYLNFQITLMPEDRERWLAILTEARRHPQQLVPVSVGTQDSTQPFESKVYVAFRLYPSYAWAVKLALCALATAIVALGARSNLLRVPPPLAALSRKRPPFSLARVQMAWWFYIVIAAFLYIWLITGAYNSLTPSVLGLIGISASTGLAAVFVDADRDSKAREKTSGTTAGHDTSRGDLPEAPRVPESRGFFRDILSDAQGVSFHRFQIVVWSIVLAGVFVRQVQDRLMMPDFDAMLLSLMGISSGTYVSFKFQEKPK